MHLHETVLRPRIAPSKTVGPVPPGAGSIRRPWSGLMLAGAVVATGLAAAACGSSSSSTPTTTARATTTTAVGGSGGSKVSSASDYAWLVAKGVPANKILNTAQNGVVVASRPTQGESPAAFFGALSGTCKSLQAAVAHARSTSAAPSAKLESAWRSMLDATAVYADDCVTLARSHANADLVGWNSSLRAMNGANRSLNSVVSAIRTANAKGG